MQIAASEYRSAANKIQTTLKRKFRGDEPTKELAKVWPGHPPQAILFELFDHAADLIRNDVYKSIFVELPNILHIPPVELYGQDLADLFFGNDLPSAAAEKEKEVVVLDAEYRAAASTLKRVLSSRFKSSMPSHELARIWPHHPPQAMLYDLFHEPLSILRDPSRIDLLLKLASVLELSADKLYGEKLAGMFAAAADHAAKLAAQEAAIDGAASSDLDIPADSNVAITALQTKENKAPAPDGVSATEIDQPSHEVAHPTSADVDIIAADGLPLAREVPKPDVASALELHLSPSDDVSIPSPYIPDLEENKIPTQHGVATSEAAYPLSDADIAADALSPADLPLAQDEASAFEKGQFLNSGADIITNDVVQLTDEETDQNGASSTVATQPHTNTVDFVVAVASELAINAEVPQIAQNSSATETQRIKSEEGPRADTGKFKVPRRKAHQPQATTYRSGGLSKLNLDKSLISVRGEVTRDPRPSNSVESISQSGLDDLWNKLNDKYPILSAVLRVEANSLERLYQKVLARFGNYDQEIFYRQMAGLSDGAWNAEKKRLYPIAATLGLALNYSDTVGLYAMHSTASLTESELDITRVEGGGPAQVQTSTSTGSPVNPPETIINQNSFVENTTEEALIEASDGKGTGLVQDALALITSSELGAENRAIPETEATADHNLPISGSQDLERSLASPADGIINKGSLRGLDQGVEDNRLRKKAVGTDLPNASEDQSIALSKPLSSHGQRPMDGPGDTSSLMSTVKSGVVTPAPTEEAINRQSRLLSSYDAFSDEFIAACSAYKIDPLDSKGILCIHDVERAFVQWGFSRDTVESIVNAFLNSDKDFQRTGRPPSVARTFAEKVGVSFNQVYSVEAPDIFRVEANPRRNRTPSSVVQEGPKRPMPSDVQLSPLQQQLKDAEAKRERIRAAAANLILFRHRQPSEQVSKTGSQDDTPRLDSFPFAQENLLALIEGFAALDPPVETIGKLDIYLKNLYSNDSLSRPLPNRTALSQFFGGLLILTQRSHGSIKPTPVANLIATAAGVSPRIAYEKFLSKSAKRPSGPIVIDQLSSSGALIDPC